MLLASATQEAGGWGLVFVIAVVLLLASAHKGD